MLRKIFNRRKEPKTIAIDEIIAQGEWHQLVKSSELKTIEGLNNTIENIQEWFKGKGLDKEDSKAQYGKLIEEVEELGEALSESDLNHITEELADVVIVVIGIALQQNIDFKQALDKGYKKISKRKGIVRNGTFIKEEDLKKEGIENE